MKFIVDRAVFKKFPNLVVAIPVILGFDSTKFAKEALEFLRATEAEVKETSSIGFLNDPRVTAYFDCFKGFGVDPQKILPAHVALTKRVLEGGLIPDINPMVNLYNAMSVKYLTPFGGEDLDSVYGDFTLKFAQGGEQWVPIGGDKSKPAQAGDLVWGDDFDLSTKSLNWRQCDRTKMTPETTNGYFIMDGFADVNKDNIVKAAEEFIGVATKLFGGKGQIYWLDKDSPVVEVPFTTKKVPHGGKEKINTIDKSLKQAKIKMEEKIEAKKEYLPGTVAYMIASAIFEAVRVVYPEVKLRLGDISLEHPTVEEHGDYSTNVAMKYKINPEAVVNQLHKAMSYQAKVEKGFINFTLSREELVGEVGKIRKEGEKYGQIQVNVGRKIMVEFAHPNTHKELHVGHMRTLITGESLARILAASGATVFRANYQGDIGPHVAKAIWGTQRLLDEKNMTWEQAGELSLKEKAHLLGEGYVRGNNDYGVNKEEIDGLNKKLYEHNLEVWPVYEQTRQWSLDYYDEFYRRFYTRFDRLYFESEMAPIGKKNVLDNLGKVFSESDGAVVFKGERCGLHTRVFITSDGNPTYEGKDMALVFAQFKDFPFDKIIHVVANEQAGYFQVIMKAIEEIDPKFVGRQFHLSMGMVQLVGKKISSRTGELITVDGLIDEVKKLLKPMLASRDYSAEEKADILEKATVAAVKHSVLKSSPLLNATFDIQKSVSLDGDSGPYLQYTYARAKSVLRKAGELYDVSSIKYYVRNEKKNRNTTPEEMAILRYLYRFPEVVEMAARTYSPNLVCSYLFELAKRFNNFYNNVPILGPLLRSSQAAGLNEVPIIGASGEGLAASRLQLTAATAQVLKNGLNLLGIAVLERM